MRQSNWLSKERWASPKPGLSSSALWSRRTAGKNAQPIDDSVGVRYSLTRTRNSEVSPSLSCVRCALQVRAPTARITVSAARSPRHPLKANRLPQSVPSPRVPSRFQSSTQGGGSGGAIAFRRQMTTSSGGRASARSLAEFGKEEITPARGIGVPPSSRGRSQRAANARGNPLRFRRHSPILLELRPDRAALLAERVSRPPWPVMESRLTNYQLVCVSSKLAKRRLMFQDVLFLGRE